MIKPVITLNQVKPATPKVSDKYSYNLWKWVSQFQKDYHQLPSVYAVVPVSETFEMEELKKGRWPIYLGIQQPDGSLSAAELNSVLGCQPQIWSFTPEVHFESTDYSPRLKAGGSITRFAPSRSIRIPSQRDVHRNTDRSYKIVS